jgi:hypothetical protein
MKMSEPSQPMFWNETELSSMSSAGASPVRTSAPLENKVASKLIALASGSNISDSLASFDQTSSSWRTSQTCLEAQASGRGNGLALYSEAWPRSGMMRSGTAFQLRPSAPLTYGTGFGSSPSHSIPTPCASDNIVRRETYGQLNFDTNKAVTLNRFVQRWPTPTVQDARGRDRHNQKDGGVILSLLGEARVWPTPTANRWSGPQSHGKNAILGKLNPIFVEWLMGFPMGWTMSVDLLSALSETQSSRKSRT